MVDCMKYTASGALSYDFTVSTNAFSAGKTAMMMVWSTIAGPVYNPKTSKVSSKVGVAICPGVGSLRGTIVCGGWGMGIPKNAKNPDGAWAFIQMAVDSKGATDLENIVGALPTNRAVLAAAKDPFTRFFAQVAAHPQVPLLDSIVPLKVALLYYVQLQAAFSGKTSPLQAMQNVDKGLKTLNP